VAERIYLPKRSGVWSLGVGGGIVSVRRETGAKGQTFLAIGEIKSGEGRLLAQKELVENKRPDGKCVGFLGLGGLSGSSDWSCRGPITHKFAVRKA
jgi:hypothetical protein